MSVQGATLFSDPNGLEWMIVAAGGRTFATRQNNVAREIPLNGNTLTGDCSFTQTFDRLILWRGTAAAPLVLNDFATGWQAVTEQTSEAGAGSGTQPIPNSDGATFFQNRVFVPFIYTDKKDFVAVGDIGNYTRYAYPQNAFRFNDGTDDEIVDLAPFGRSSLVVFKEKSVRIVDGLTPDTNGNYTSAFIDVVSDTHGLVAPRAWAAVGRDLFYVSTGGVTSLRLTEENKVKGVDLPLSAPLQDTWGRIKWSLRDRIRVAYWDSKLYVAVPLDDARTLDATNLAPTAYDGSGNATVTGLTEGNHYYYLPGGNDLTLVNGTETLTTSGIFTAQGTGVTLTGTPSAVTTATLKHYTFYDVNNAVLVYDFITQAWCGADQTDGVTHVKEWMQPTIDGQRRLVAITEDGLLRLWEDGYEDEIKQDITYPWWDVQLLQMPQTYDALTVNYSTAALPDFGAATNTGSTWGCDTLAHARENLYLGLRDTWGVTNATLTKLDWGFRVTSTVATAVPAMNYYHAAGYFQMPVVVMKATLGCFRFDLFTQFYFTTQPVAISVTTRGYPCADPDQKRYRAATLRLQTWHPNFSVVSTTDGVNETDTVLANQTRSRTSYAIAAAAWDATNANDDHGNPWREDYSVTLGTGFDFGSGVELNLHQTSLVPASLEQRGVYAQLTLTNTTGRCILSNVSMEALPGERSRFTKY